jgi:hypothetical protein
MSRAEYDRMIVTGRVQQSKSGGMTSVCVPASPESYARQASPGSMFVAFGVDDDDLVQGGRADWFLIPGPGSFHAKRLGRTLDEMPVAHDIQVVIWPT